MTPLYIFDLDGTLALIDHRRHLVERPPCPYCGWKKQCAHDNLTEEELEIRGLPPGQREAFSPNWPAFFRACVDDLPNLPVIETLHNLVVSGADVWVWSGRSSEVMAETKQWLMDHVGIEDLQLCMRVEGDFTPDEQLKACWLDNMAPVDRRRLVAVFDDRDKVVAMWRDKGVACFQVAPGGF